MNEKKNKSKEEYKAWKSKGYKIVFTNGCFDLLHQGHLDLLSSAAKLGDRLIVGLNSDKSVKTLKGDDRPIQTEKFRKSRLIELDFVNCVQIFNEKTPINLIKKIKPDVLVKGGDYGFEDIVGSLEIKCWGGITKIIPLTPGYSTTEIIKKNKM
tara:strand:- start:621 stop:1082 length:462 start_codon:yes stop_codon:yes gene_type:complete